MHGQVFSISTINPAINSGSSDELNVDSSPDMMHKSTSNDHVQSGCDDEDSSEVSFPVWVAFRQGYVSGKFLTPLPNGRCRVLILPGQEVIEVNTEVVERANPPSFDRVDDLIKLRYINESSVTHSFIQRYGSGLIFTYASGVNLISINPMMSLNIYSEKVMDLFTDCEIRYDMPPHVFSVAQLILARLKRRLFYSIVTMEQQQHLNSDPVYNLPFSLSQQVLCLLGRSGSGKTRISNDVFTYMIYQSEKSMNGFNHSNHNNINHSNTNNAVSSRINACRLRALFNMLDSFTCSRIILNTNGSRALRLFSLEFAKIHALPIVNQPEDIGLIITGLTTRLLLFERSRVTDRPEREPNFHIFYYLLAGLDDESRQELFLTDLDAPNLFMTRLHRPEDKESAKILWKQLCRDAEVLQFDLKQEWLTGGLTRLLAVIYHLGCAGYCNELKQEDMLYFANYKAAQHAAYLLNCSLDTLNELIFEPIIIQKSTHNNVNTDQNSINWTTKDCLHAFVQDLYHLIVNILICLINRCVSTPKSDESTKMKVAAQLILVDPVGLQIPHSTTFTESSVTFSSSPERNENPKSGNFSDLIFNYVYERFNQLYFDSTIMLDEQRLKHDGLTSPVPYENFCRTKNILNFIDNTSWSKNPNSSLNKDTSFNSTAACNAMFPGLFWLLDSVSQGSELSKLSEILSQMYQIQRKQYENRDLRIIRRFKRSASSFILNHNLSTTPIEYTPSRNWFAPYHRSTWCKKIISLLGQSQLASLRSLIGMLEYKEDYLSSFVPVGPNHIGVCSNVKSVMDLLTRSLYDCAAHNASYNPNDPGSGFNDGGPPSGMHWIHCFLPVSTAGLCQLNEEISINQLIRTNYASGNHHNATTRINSTCNNKDSNDIFNESNPNPSTSYLHELVKRYPNKNLVFSPARICVNLIRSQIRGIELINTLQAVKLSYPDRLSLKEFRNRFACLLPLSSKVKELNNDESSNRTVANEILNSLRYSPETFQLGNANIYLRTFIIPQLVHRLANSAGLFTTDQELIHVQPACKSYITDYGDEEMVVEESIAPRLVPKNAKSKSIEIQEGQTTDTSADYDALVHKKGVLNGRPFVSLIESEDNPMEYTKLAGNFGQPAVECTQFTPSHEENDNILDRNTIDKEIILSSPGRVSVSISREMGDTQPWESGHTVLYGSSETIRHNTDNPETVLKVGSNGINKEIHTTKPSPQPSLNNSHIFERKVGIHPLSVSLKSVRNGFDPQEKNFDKQIKLEETRLHSSSLTDSNGETQILIRSNPLSHSLDCMKSDSNVHKKGIDLTASLNNADLFPRELQLTKHQSNLLLNDRADCDGIQNCIITTPDFLSASPHTSRSLNIQLTETECELTKLKRLYSEAVKRIKELETLLNELKSKLSTVSAENIRFKQDRDRARTDLELAEENRLQAEQQVKVISLKLEQAEKRHILLLESINKTCVKDGEHESSEYTILYPNAPEKLLEELHQLRSSNHSLTLQMTDLQATLNDLKKELEITYGNYQKSEKTIEKLRSDLMRIQDEHEANYEETHNANQVKLRQLEERLDATQQENSRLTRDKHQLELEVSTLDEELKNALASLNNDEIERKLRKELKIMKSLLAEKDSVILEISSNPEDYQAQIKKLRDRVDELDELNEIANRQKRVLQTDLEDVQQQLSSALRTQKEFAEELSRSKRELLELQNQFTDQEEAHKETRDKLHGTMANLTVKEATIQAQVQEIEEFLVERKEMQSQIDELKLNLNTNTIDQVPRSDLERLEAKVRELGQRLDIEASNRIRIQYSLDRARESIEQLTNERDKLLASEANEREQNRKLARQLREAQQDEKEASRRATAAQRRAEEAQLDANKAIHEAACSRAEMNALLRRTQDLEALIRTKQSELDYEDLLLYDSSGEDLALGD
ncbi:unnamed protein product [Heterobilharzia americana]|nr:unnamed protein product [Heterobilharzia americana]